MKRDGSARRRAHNAAWPVFIWNLVICVLYIVPAASAQVVGRGEDVPIIVDVRIEQEGRPVTDPLISGLIETSAGEPLSMREVRETITHLMILNRFEDVEVFQEAAPTGVRLRYVLLPLHPIDRIEYRGTLGVTEQELRRTITDRFGAEAPTARIEELQRQLQALYRG
ncbi:MAG: hypothetical protein ABL993_12805, partial [Vicinamibacterales bacterium]